MILVWRGLGLLVPVIVFVCAYLANLITNALFDDSYFDTHRAPLAIAILVAAVLVFFLGRYLDDKNPPRVFVDPETNQEVVFRKKHDFFFIKVMYWGYLLAIISFISLYLK